ncbi:ATP-binding cassette sub-family G member 4-like [Phlebotomus argentipes]|uniref:ATP-binding cassette sub-family G member 4-like n=1 Tax=Phlebotomus argentipes TaxID=94469 RepID=UPI0028931AFF|nr:ATP-binding cassette sub-family G member 4-like [Phlebotomus argentipes]
MAAIDIDIKAYRKSIDIHFHQLAYTTPGKDSVKILHDISGKFNSGKLTAILGPSGAGKTTLLNILSGFKTKGVTGTILVNGAVRDKNDFRNKSSYIPQEFPMLGKLTTLETLKTAADLKLPVKLSGEVKQKIISDVTQILGLEKCLNTRVETLSGGERKRLSIGVELITNPPVMFFDEPTSGLDSVSCDQVVTHLKALAHSGRTVVCVIHQPSSHILELFDDLFVLSEGQCIYSGAVDGIIPAFQEAGYDCPQYYNRADFALEVASDERDGNLTALIENHRNKHGSSFEDTDGSGDEFTYVLSPESADKKKQKLVQKTQKLVYPVSRWNQFLILSKRSLLCTYRDFFFAQLRIITHIIVAMLLGFVFFDIGSDAANVLTNISCLFFFILFIFFGNSMPTALCYPSEASVFLREHLNNWYSLGAYFMSKIIADLPLQIMCPSLFILIGYFLSGQPQEEHRFAMMWFICLLTAISAQAMGLLAGAAFNVQMGIFLIPASCIPMLVFSGYFIRFNELHFIFKPLSYISLFRYSFEGSIQAIYGFDRGNLTCSETFCYYKNADKILKTLNMTENTFGWDLAGLLLWAVVFQIGVFIALKIRLRQAK